MSENNLIEYCLDKVKKLQRFKPLTIEEIKNVENELNITLPNDFKELCSYYSYEFLDAGFEFYSFDNGVIFETKALRKVYNFPDKYIVLAEDDASVLFLQTISENESKVIWADETDSMNILNGKDIESNSTIYNSFAEFYKFLLDEEEKGKEES